MWGAGELGVECGGRGLQAGRALVCVDCCVHVCACVGARLCVVAFRCFRSLAAMRHSNVLACRCKLTVLDLVAILITVTCQRLVYYNMH